MTKRYFTDSPPRTGFDKLDNAVGRRPRAILGMPYLRDPTLYNDATKRLFSYDRNDHLKFDTIDEAYRKDSYVRQGVDKYVELCTKQGWDLDCKTPEPILYLKSRFQMMGLMTGTCFSILVDYLVKDFIQYGNAFWIKQRVALPEPIPGLPSNGAYGTAPPVLGYFRADPKRMRPVWSKDNRQVTHWEFVPKAGKPVRFLKRDIIHFAYNVPAGEIFGSSFLCPVLEDVGAYRQCEEYVLRLLYKHLNPLLHHSVPDVTQNGQGRQEDVDAAYIAHSIEAPDGMIITPPGHEIRMVGAESQALRAEPYMKMLRERVFAGLGVNAIVMGEGESTSVGSADAMTVTMHNRAKFYQRQLGEMLTEYVLYELLLEGNFNPLTPIDYCSWEWVEIETEALMKKQNHVIQMWSNNLLSEDEARRGIGKEPLSAADYKKTYIQRVKIPTILAQGQAKEMALAATLSTKDGPAAQVDSRAKPSNQHGDRGGPKVRPR